MTSEVSLGCARTLCSHVWKQTIAAKSPGSVLRNTAHWKGLKNDNKSPSAEVVAAVNTITTNRKTVLTIKDEFQEAECLLMLTQGSEYKYEKNKNNKGKRQWRKFFLLPSVSAVHLLER